MNAAVRCRGIDLVIVLPRMLIWQADGVMSGTLLVVSVMESLCCFASWSAIRFSRR